MFYLVGLPFSSCFTLKNVMTSMSHSLKMAPFDRPHTSSYSFSIVTTTLYCIVCATERDVGRNSRFLYPPCTQQPLPRGGGGCEYFRATFPSKLTSNGSKYCGKIQPSEQGARTSQTTDGIAMSIVERNVVTFR